MNLKVVAGIVFVLGALWFALKKPARERPAKAPVPSVEAQASKAVVPIDESRKDVGASIKETQQKRQIFKDASALRIALFRPSIRDDQYNFTLSYAPIARHCVNGDIDLIQRHMRPAQTLQWTLENQSGKAVMPARIVNASQLNQPFAVDLKIPVTDKGTYYKLALCIAGQGSCDGQKAIPYTAMEGQRKNMELKSGLFYTQNFRVDDDGIRIFDSREYKDAQAYKSFVKKIDGNSGADRFVETMVQEQKILGSLPVKTEANKLNIQLYVRNNVGC